MTKRGFSCFGYGEIRKIHVMYKIEDGDLVLLNFVTLNVTVLSINKMVPIVQSPLVISER